jgi:hypothetical protein
MEIGGRQFVAGQCTHRWLVSSDRHQRRQIVLVKLERLVGLVLFRHLILLGASPWFDTVVGSVTTQAQSFEAWLAV